MPLELGGFHKPISTSEWIRDHLLSVESDYPFHLYSAFKKTILELNPDYHTPTYESFRKYVYILEKLGLIEFDHEEDAQFAWVEKRRYYRIVLAKSDDPAWYNPQKAYKE